MKTLVIYANCQGCIGLKHFLTQWTDYEVHSIQNFDNADVELPYDLFKRCDVFVYQPLNPRHGERSTDHILTLLKPECVAVSFPYVIASCFHTLNTYELDTLESDIETSGMKHVGHSYRSQYWNGTLNFEFQKRYDAFVDLMRRRETRTDVKVLDYIIANFRTKILFLTSNHLTSHLLVEMTRQILERIGKPLKGVVHVGMNEAGMPEYPQAVFGGIYNYDFYKFDFKNDDPNVVITDFDTYQRKYARGDDLEVILWIGKWLRKFKPLSDEIVYKSYASFGIPLPTD